MPQTSSYAETTLGRGACSPASSRLTREVSRVTPRVAISAMKDDRPIIDVCGDIKRVTARSHATRRVLSKLGDDQVLGSTGRRCGRPRVRVDPTGVPGSSAPLR